MGYLNICSLYNKTDDLRIILSKENYDVFCIVESWLTTKITNDMLFFNQYRIFRIDRQNRKGGGICVLVKRNLNVIVCVENVIMKNQLELIHISLNFTHCLPLQILTFYRPPASNMMDFVQDFSLLLNNINYSSLPMLLIGDINYDLNIIKKSSDTILQFFNSYGLTPIKCGDTRQGISKSSCIDWLLWAML
jgi:exonuclease III